MSARHKINASTTLGSLVLAAIIGGLAGSWSVFVIAAVVLFAVAVESGEISLCRSAGECWFAWPSRSRWRANFFLAIVGGRWLGSP